MLAQTLVYSHTNALAQALLYFAVSGLSVLCSLFAAPGCMVCWLCGRHAFMTASNPLCPFVSSVPACVYISVGCVPECERNRLERT